AGQSNGTTGYEEAGAQGLIAGGNGGLAALGQPPFSLYRWEAYIGVVIDGLAALGTSEPYRMFRSRAECRLTLRADNADLRLTEEGIGAGCVGRERAALFATKKLALEEANALLGGLTLTPNEAAAYGLSLRQ